MVVEVVEGVLGPKIALALDTGLGVACNPLSLL